MESYGEHISFWFVLLKSCNTNVGIPYVSANKIPEVVLQCFGLAGKSCM